MGIKIEKLETKLPVYDITVEDNENFFANNILVHNCAEIVQFTGTYPGVTAICTLTSIPLNKCLIDGKFDFDLLGQLCEIIVKSLNIAIDINDYSTKEGELGGKSQRALGIGVQGLADLFVLLKMPFTSPEARKLNKEIFEAIYYNTVKASCKLAKETGLTYDHYEDSPMSKGEMQWHMWGLTEDNLSGRHDWKKLISDIKKYGVRNSLYTCLPPTASSSRVIGSNEAFEPFTSNLYVRKVTGGEFAMVNKHLVRDLEEQNLWNRDILNELIKNNGSIQNIPVISDELKERYKTVWEIPQSILLEMSAERGPFIDQSQSLNIFMSTPTVSKLTSSHVKAWKLGLKTGQYYLRSEAVDNKAKHLAIDMSEPKKERPEGSQFECTGCSS